MARDRAELRNIVWYLDNWRYRHESDRLKEDQSRRSELELRIEDRANRAAELEGLVETIEEARAAEGISAEAAADSAAQRANPAADWDSAAHPAGGPKRHRSGRKHRRTKRLNHTVSLRRRRRDSRTFGASVIQCKQHINIISHIGAGQAPLSQERKWKIGKKKKQNSCAASATSCVRTRAVKRKGDATMEKRLGVEGVDAGEG